MASEYSVKVNKVPQGTSPDELRAVFQAAGFASITDVYLPEKFAKFEFGFVRFSSLDEAQQAAALQDLCVRGSVLGCELAVNDKKRASAAPSLGKARPVGKGGPPCSGKGMGREPPEMPRMPEPGTKAVEHSVWVGSLPGGVTPDDLREAVARCGIENTTDVYLPPGRDYGFLRFGTLAEAERAMARCAGLELAGVRVELRLSTTEKRSIGLPAAALPAPPLHGGRLQDWGAVGSQCKGGDWYGPPVVHGKGGNWQRPLPPSAKGGDWYGPAMHAKPSACSGKGGFWDGEAAFGKGAWDGALAPGRAPSLGHTPSQSSTEHSVWVGTLPAGTSVEDLRDAFRESGVESMTDVYIPPGRDFGFVRFATYEEAEQARQGCNPLRVRGASVELKVSTSEKRAVGQQLAPPLPLQQPVLRDRYLEPYEVPGYGSTSKASDMEVSVKVGNINPSTTIEDLREAFLIRGVDTMTDVYIPRGKSFGFIRFHKLSEAHMALECSGMEVRGNRITCEMAEGDKRSSEFFTGPPAPANGGQLWHGGCGLKGGGPCSKGWTAGRASFGIDASSFRNEVSVKVGNLPPDCSPDEVCSAFAAQGIDSMTDCYIPNGRRFGFLRFTTAAEGRYALQRQIWIRGHLLELEPALGTKRTPDEMVVSEQARQKRPALARDFGSDAPHDPNISPDAPSVKVSGIPPNTTSPELHKALLDAGCTGKVTDVYVPKGNRGFGFFRFASFTEAEEASRLQVWVRGVCLSLDIAVQERKVHSKLEEGASGLQESREWM